MYEKRRNNICVLCSNLISNIKSFPDICDHLFHYKCLRNYVDNKLEKNESITCPTCNNIFHQIGNKFNKSSEILFQNVSLTNDESNCCICFSKYNSPVASTDCCSHKFCLECINKWCTFKHECPMDRSKIKFLLLSDFPGGHIISKIRPPQIVEDLNVIDDDYGESLDTICEICNSGDNDHLLLLCDSCNLGYHTYCLTEPLFEVPEGNWFCEVCINENNFPNSGIIESQSINELQNQHDSNIQNFNVQINQITSGSLLNEICELNNAEHFRRSRRTLERNLNIERISTDDFERENQEPGFRRNRRLGFEESAEETSAQIITFQGQDKINCSNESTKLRALHDHVSSDEEIETSNSNKERLLRIKTVDFEKGSCSKKSRFKELSSSDDEFFSQPINQYRKVSSLNNFQMNDSESYDLEDNEFPVLKRIKKNVNSNCCHSYNIHDFQPSTSIITKVRNRVKIKKHKVIKRKKKKSKTISKRRLVTKRSSKKKRTTKRKTKLFLKKIKIKDSFSNQIITNFPKKLSIFGRGKQLPMITDEDLNIKVKPSDLVTLDKHVKPPCASSNIISLISEAQSNFKNISFATITRLADGTLIHKSNKEKENNILNINKAVPKMSNTSSTSDQYENFRNYQSRESDGLGCPLKVEEREKSKMEFRKINESVDIQSTSSCSVQYEMFLTSKKNKSEGLINSFSTSNVKETKNSHNVSQKINEHVSVIQSSTSCSTQYENFQTSQRGKESKAFENSGKEMMKEAITSDINLKKIIDKIVSQYDYILKSDYSKISDRIYQKIVSKKETYKNPPSQRSFEKFAETYVQYYIKKNR